MPNISLPRLLELEKLERELIERQELDALQPFVDRFATNLAIMVGTVPYSEWSNREKLAFTDAFKGAALMKEFYLERLKKVCG